MDGAGIAMEPTMQNKGGLRSVGVRAAAGLASWPWASDSPLQALVVVPTDYGFIFFSCQTHS